MAEKNFASKRFAEKSQRVLIYIILTVVSLVWIFPFVYLIFQSFAEVANPKSIFPEKWTFANYATLFTSTSKPFFSWWINTFLNILTMGLSAGNESTMLNPRKSMLRE